MISSYHDINLQHPLFSLVRSFDFNIWSDDVISYESVYARHYTNATTMQYGYLNMVLPFMTVLVTPVICSFADRHRSHRTHFTLTLVITTICLCLYALMPLLSSTGTHRTPHIDPSGQSPPLADTSAGDLLIGPWIYYCINSMILEFVIGINTCLSDSFAVLQAEETGTSFGRIIVWGTFGWASVALVLSLINQCSFLPRLVPGLLFGSLLLAIDALIVIFWPKSRDFKLDHIPLDAALTVTGSASHAHKDANSYLPMNESALINLGHKIAGHRRTISPLKLGSWGPKTAKLKEPAASQSDRMVPVNASANKSMQNGKPVSARAIANSCLNHAPETICVASGTNSHTSEMVSSIEQDISASKDRGLDLDSVRNQRPFFNHKVADTVTDSRYYQDYKSVTSFKMQLILLGLILNRRKTLIRYLLLFVLSGFFMSMHWNYFFLYLERIYSHHFELITALSMVGQSVLGELPFFILSRRLIDLVGRSHTLSISVISIGLRFLLYRYLLPNASMYFIVVADCFQGPNYGLFYVVMTEVGLEFSYCDDQTIAILAKLGQINPANKHQVESVRLSLRSTVQSVAFACYEGLGVGLGSLVGGWVVATWGFETLWLSAAIGSIIVGLINLLVEFFCREYDPESEKVDHGSGSGSEIGDRIQVGEDDDEDDDDLSDRQAFAQAHRRGTLEHLSSPERGRIKPVGRQWILRKNEQIKTDN